MKDFAERELKRLNVDFCILTAKKLTNDNFTPKDSKKLEQITKQRETLQTSLNRTQKHKKRNHFNTKDRKDVRNIPVRGAELVGADKRTYRDSTP